MSRWSAHTPRRKMDHMESAPDLLVPLAFALGGVVKGVTGMGLPTVAVSVMALWFTPAQAAAMLVVPSLATNLAQCRGPALRPLCRRLWPVWLALLVVTVMLPQQRSGSTLLDSQVGLGVVLLLYGAWGLWRPVLPGLSASVSRLSGIGLLAGAMTGAVAALTAVFVMPLVPYLQALRLERDALVQALGLSFCVATLALALRLQLADALPAAAWWSWRTAASLGAAAAGLWLGSVLRSRLSPGGFRRAVAAVFVGLGGSLLWRAA